MKSHIHQFLHKKERGQAIILVAFGIIGLVAMVGLVVDTGVVFIEYGKLKRGVDAAAIAAAQEYRSVSGGALDPVAMTDAARNFIQLNQSDVVDVTVHSCAEIVGSPGRPDQCNPDPIGHPEKNRKLAQVTASKKVDLTFLRVIGFNQIDIATSAVGEAATLDLVLVIDTSASMAYETAVSTDPKICNPANTCQPMLAVKEVAENFINTIYFPYDRVSIVTLTSQVPGGSRDPQIILPLTSVKGTVVNGIQNIKVFQPRDCIDPDDYAVPATIPGSCLDYAGGVYNGNICPFSWPGHAPDLNNPDPSSCNSSNVGGSLQLAAGALTDVALTRPESFWVVVALMSGPANVTNPDTNSPPVYPFGFCPKSTWYSAPFCRDRHPLTRHQVSDTAPFTNPLTGIPEPSDPSIYDTEDFTRDQADQLAGASNEGGVTIYTIGLGAQVKSTGTSDDFYPDGVTKIPPAEYLLKYVAECAGESSPDDCVTPVVSPQVIHGQYFYAPTGGALTDIFELIANNIATRISE